MELEICSSVRDAFTTTVQTVVRRVWAPDYKTNTVVWAPDYKTNIDRSLKTNVR